MISQPPAMFDHADRHEHELTDRQRQVLRMLAAGRTNAEIAAALGVTFDGAKWNVSEVLTKLGLETREEAAAYYRWRNRLHRRVGRGLLGLLPFAPAKAGIAAGAVGTLAVAGVVAFAVLGAAQPVSADDDQPFYLEARMEQRSRAVVYDQGAAPRDEWTDTAWQTRWWWGDATHQRAEASVVAPDSVSLADVAVADGTDVYRQMADEPYRRSPIAAGDPPLSVASHAPAIGPTDADSVDELVAEYAKQGHARRAGTDEILGRQVVVIEFGPTGLVMGPDGRWVDDGSARVWVDPERMFVMRFETVGASYTVRAEVTALRYGEDQPADVFAFEPRPGTGENTCFSDGSTVPPGFLAVPVGQVPAGMTVQPYQVSADTEGGQAVCQSVRTMVTAATPGDGFIAVAEDRDHPALLPIERDRVVTLTGGVTAYARQQDGTLVSLAWVSDGLGVELRSDVLTVSELATFANAMLAP